MRPLFQARDSVSHGGLNRGYITSEYYPPGAPTKPKGVVLTFGALILGYDLSHTEAGSNSIRGRGGM
jgi:hypothetical protein